MENSNKEKQIEEMAKELCDATQKTNQGCNSICYPRGMCAHCKVMAEHLYNAGYRKTSDIAREIFEEFETLLNLSKCYGDSGIYFERDIETDIAELKKKYTESEKDNG